MADLMQICDPQTVNSRALADQRAIVAAHGGAEAVVPRVGLARPRHPVKNPLISGRDPLRRVLQRPDED